MRIKPDETGKIDYSALKLSPEIARNKQLMQEIFAGDKTVILREFCNRENPDLKFLAVFVDGMVDSLTINQGIIKPVTDCTGIEKSPDLLESIGTGAITGNEIELTQSVEDVVSKIMYGDTAVFAQGQTGALIVNSKGFATRGVSEPDDEKNLKGPREGFNESMMTNLGLLRRKLQTSDFRVNMLKFGSRTNTKACLCYMDSLVDKEILEDVKRRLKTIEVDGALDVNQIGECVKDNPYSPFKTIGTSEKPDIVAAKLLEGRIALMLDGTPMTLTMPYLFIENFQSADDYYINFYYGTIGRILRLLAFFISTSLPALYVAFTAYNQEMIPPALLISISVAKQGVPLPIFLEIISMTVIFEILRETGIRNPDKFGQAMSIVGALIVGQAAVEAKIVSEPTVIIVALAGVTGLMLPKLSGAVISIRIGMLLAAAMLGLYGYFFSVLALVIYLLGMKSFKIEYTSQFFSLNPQTIKDVYIRAPMRFLKTRPLFISPERNRRA